MIYFTSPIIKARNKKTTRTYNRLFNLSESMAGAVRLDLFRGLKKFKSHVDPESVYQSWKSGNYSKIIEAIPWKKLPHELEPAAKKLQAGLVKSADFSIEGMKSSIPNRDLRYDMKNPRLRDYVNRRTGELVVNIQSDTQKTIQNAVARSFNEALTPRDVAGIIRGSIGLYPRQEQALRNYRQNLVASGFNTEKIDTLSGRYEDRLLNQRAMMIARTETRLASNVAQQSIWEQASNNGFVPSGAMRVWIVDGNPCDVCTEMDGVEVGLYEPWNLPDGRAVMVPTESHPNCMCGMELKLG